MQEGKDRNFPLPQVGAFQDGRKALFEDAAITTHVWRPEEGTVKKGYGISSVTESLNAEFKLLKS